MENNQITSADHRRGLSPRAAAPLIIEWRDETTPGDIESVRRLCQETMVFSPDEVMIAAELVQERLTKGPASGYHFLFAEIQGRLLGYICFGPIACTLESWDVFWIVVDQVFRGQGVGGQLLERAEHSIFQAGGRRVYIETSSRPDYDGARAFYLGQGCRPQAVMPDFYAPGDDKVIYLKILS
ncbi:MAG: GNAT family N-acetyltransferase [Pseudomonadota bacterium]